MSEREPDRRVSALLTRLDGLGAGERARLKRDAGKALAEAQNIGLFYRLLPHGVREQQEEIFFLAATLYPLAEGGGRGNFGDTLRRARDVKNHQGLDRRVEALLDADATQLAFRLRQAVRYVQSKRERVNWQALAEDLLQWGAPSRHVQKRWARAYFAGGEPRVAGTAQTSDPNTDKEK